MWEINNASQYLCFLYSIGIGVALGLIYDFIKIDRIVFKRKNLFVFCGDILFWLISTFVFFSFSVVFSNGQIRGYLLFGSLLGFLIYKLTLSRIFILIVSPLKRVSRIIKLCYLKFITKLLFYIKNIVNKVKIFVNYFLFSKKRKNIKNN